MLRFSTNGRTQAAPVSYGPVAGGIFDVQGRICPVTGESKRMLLRDGDWRSPSGQLPPGHYHRVNLSSAHITI